MTSSHACVGPPKNSWEGEGGSLAGRRRNAIIFSKEKGGEKKNGRGKRKKRGKRGQEEEGLGTVKASFLFLSLLFCWGGKREGGRGKGTCLNIKRA